MDKSKKLIIKLSEIGRKHQYRSYFMQIEPFRNFFDKDGNLDYRNLDLNDGHWTRREILTRFLLLNIVLDQGPDIEGLNIFIKNIVNELYRKEIRIFHRPLDLFKELGVAIDEILNCHEVVKKLRSAEWAKDNKSNADKYNLFMDNSKQVLNYTIFRWGVPLAVPLLLEKDNKTLIDYLESWGSAEIMSQQLKDNNRYGLGKALGDKAGHVFAKKYIHTFKLARLKGKNWSNLSYELPLDSNAGRVLFRTGFLLMCAELKDYKKWEVIQKDKGKGGTNYIRVTNIRGKKIKKANTKLLKLYKEKKYARNI